MAEVRFVVSQGHRIGRINKAKVAAMTDEQIAQHMVEDGEEPEVVHDDWYPAPLAVRQRLGMTQERIAADLRLPVSTWRNWEQGRVQVDPIVRSLLLVLWRIPLTAMQSLTRCPICLRIDATSEPATSTGQLITCPSCGSLHEEVTLSGVRSVRAAQAADRQQRA